jgi:type IV pilus assembly protein PilY1
MKRPTPIQTLAASASAAVLLSIAGGAQAQYAVSQLPPLANQGGPANLVLMIDDSGSMASAFVPDGIDPGGGGGGGGCTPTTCPERGFFAAAWNPLAYDPSITYTAPNGLDANGNVKKLADASFFGAYSNGFDTSIGTAIDLSGNYQPTAQSQPNSASQTYAPLPTAAADVAAIGASAGGGAPAFYYLFDPNIVTTPATASAPAVTCGGIPAKAATATAAAAAAVPAQLSNNNCYTYVRVGSAEQTNFANWYSFYRTRHLAVASAASIAMADPGLAQTRVSWRSLNNCTSMTTPKSCAGYDGNAVDNQLRTFTGAQVTNFYTYLARIKAANSTPLRTAWNYIGDYFSQASPTNKASTTPLAEKGPYSVNPNQPSTTSTTPEVACVQNFSITLTDGQWNSDSPPFFDTADRKAITLPDGTPYSVNTKPGNAGTVATSIYGNDSNSDVLADIAFHYWATNLRPDLTGSATAVHPYMPVKTGPGGSTSIDPYWNPQNDPATWPHLVQFTIGIGMTNTLSAPNLPWWGGTVGSQCTVGSVGQYCLDSILNPGYTNLWNGTYPWPTVGTAGGCVGGGGGCGGGGGGSDLGKAYDLWHSAVNSRGLAFSAESPADLQAALVSSLSRVKAQIAGAQTAVAASTATLQSSTLIYVAGYDPSDWHGVLSAYGITAGTINTTATWRTTDAGKMPAAASRSLISYNSGTPGSGTGVQLDPVADPNFAAVWTGLVTAGVIPSATAATSILSWVRGDPSTEAKQGGPYRDRPVSVLGDIVDSNPVFAWKENYGYSALPEGSSATPNYPNFLIAKAAASTAGTNYKGKGMVYVGANDGMLHGFDATTGTEIFAYVPHSVLPNLPALASPSYNHQFYVDQTPYVGDACVGSSPASCSWKTVLVGTTGAGGQSAPGTAGGNGGQGVFAIDVTSPKAMESQSSAAGKVLWDMDGYSAHNTSGDPDLGYPIGRPTIARLNNGDWAAVFGNGYLSQRGCAVLFIVRLFDGAITKIDTSGVSPTSTCTATNANLSNGLGPVTLADGDGNFTTDYVYAGDLQGNLWKFDLSSATASSWGVAYGGAPLFVASASGTTACVGIAPAASTCQAITSAPALGPAMAGMTGTMVYFGTGRIFATGDAQTNTQQSFYGVLDAGAAVAGGQGSLQVETITTSGNFRTISATAVTSPKKGWYINLPVSASAGTGSERVTLSPVMAGSLLLFATVVPNADVCAGGGTSWLMAVSAGANSTSPGGTHLFASGSTQYDGMKSTVGVIEGITQLSDPANNRTLNIAGGTQGTMPIPTPSTYVKGRISWHELTR